jgi:hypothetical protein
MRRDGCVSRIVGDGARLSRPPVAHDHTQYDDPPGSVGAEA